MFSLNLALFILVVVFVVGWFAVGTQYNVRKGEDALRWLQQGLPQIGGKTTLRWLGSSVVELKIQQAKAPFRDAEVLIVLEPRDVALLWAIARLRGRRDLLIIRGALQRAPRVELEASDPQSWVLGSRDRRIRSEAWSAQSVPPLTVHSPANFSTAAAVANVALADAVPPVRLAVRRTPPNLELQWQLRRVRRYSALHLVDAVNHIADSV
ncbi:MAG: hypothetical protein ACM3KD_04150 [Hyphomicrobiaceae bacterium]